MKHIVSALLFGAVALTGASVAMLNHNGVPPTTISNPELTLLAGTPPPICPPICLPVKPPAKKHKVVFQKQSAKG